MEIEECLAIRKPGMISKQNNLEQPDMRSERMSSFQLSQQKSTPKKIGKGNTGTCVLLHVNISHYRSIIHVDSNQKLTSQTDKQTKKTNRQTDGLFIFKVASLHPWFYFGGSKESVYFSIIQIVIKCLQIFKPSHVSYLNSFE